MLKMSIGGEHTVASSRRLRQIAPKGEFVQMLMLKSGMNKQRASLTVVWTSSRCRRLTRKVRQDAGERRLRAT